MNKNTVLTNIQNVILYFKNTNWHLKNNLGKILPGSGNVISSLKNNIVAIGKAIYEIPPYRTVGNKNPFTAAGTLTKTFVIYPNNQKERISFVTTPSANDVTVLLSEGANIYDARNRGGGLKTSYIDDSFGIDRFVHSHADVGRYDGMPTAASTAIMVELPQDILSKYKSATIMNIVKKYIALGTNPILDFYTANTVETYGWNLNGSEDA